MNDKTKYFLALVLVTAGLYWVNTAPKRELPTVVASHGGLHYTTNWNATKVLTVQASGGWANVPPQEAPIGVAEWRVVAIDNGDLNQIFSETWKIPTIDGTVFNPSNQTTTGTGFNPQEWLFATQVGVFGDTPNGGRVTYRVKDLSFLDNGYRYTKGDAKVGGNAIKCASNSDSNCLYARGAYGWEVYHALSNLGSARGRISGSGVMLPIKWNVVGSLN